MKTTNLADYGYHIYGLPPIGSHSHALEFWQKKVKNENDTLYFINLYKYDFSIYHIGIGIKWLVSVQFQLERETWNIDFHVPDDYTIEMVEKRIYEMWSNNNFEMYERS